MNEELLNTVVVKSQILRYLELGYTLEYILERLDFIHLIVVSKKELENFISKHLNSN